MAAGLSTFAMMLPKNGPSMWERFESSHIIMEKTAIAVENIIKFSKRVTVENPEAAAIALSPHSAAVVLGFLASLGVGAAAEASTIELLFSYFILNFVPAGTMIMTQAGLDNLVHWVLLPNLTFLATCAIVTIIRRLLFSPLARFSGPRQAAMSNWWMAKEVGNGTFAKTIKKLHRDTKAVVIRTGPNELSVNDAEAVSKIFGGQYKKGPWYEGAKLRGLDSISGTRSAYHHPIWRRIWEKAFTPSELRNYSPDIESSVAKLVKSLKSKNGQEIDATPVVENFNIDLTTKLAFGRDAGLQDGTGDASLVTSIREYIAHVGYLGTLRNINQFLAYVTETRATKTFRTSGERLLIRRQKEKNSSDNSHDIVSHLLTEDDQTRRRFDVPRQLAANTNYLLQMGFTTGTTITETLRALAKYPTIQKKLQKEIDTHVKSGGDLSTEGLRTLPYLNAVISESLRMFNPLPMGAHATVPEGGIDMGSYKLPGYASVYIPVLSLMTDERYFGRAEEFVPERWTDQEELVKDKRAYIPWGYGVHACVGKQLALNELRVVIGRLVREFEIVAGEGYSDEDWEKGRKDYMMSVVPELKVRFNVRKV